MFRVRNTLIFLSILTNLLLVACTSTPNTPTSPALTKTSFQISWIHEYSGAGFYAAEINGHFKERGLEVTLEPGGFVDGRYIEPIDKVVSGESMFGLSSAAAILDARANGKPVVAIASILQRNPTAIIFLKSKKIEQPKDLIGKTVAVSDGGASQLFNVMLTSQGISPSTVKIIPRTDFGVGSLFDGSADALIGWIINEGVAVSEGGGEPGFMLLSDYGIPDYPTLIFTTEDIIKNQPDLVEAFLHAIIDGWNDALSDPEQGIDGVLKYNSALDPKEQLSRLEAAIPLIHPARTKVGMMDQSTWQIISKVLYDAGVLKVEVDVNTAFTTVFLDKIYGQ